MTARLVAESLVKVQASFCSVLVVDTTAQHSQMRCFQKKSRRCLGGLLQKAAPIVGRRRAADLLASDHGASRRNRVPYDFKRRRRFTGFASGGGRGAVY